MSPIHILSQLLGNISLEDIGSNMLEVRKNTFYYAYTNTNVPLTKVYYNQGVTEQNSHKN